MFESLGQYDKAIEHLQNALVITAKIGDKKGKASCYGRLGTVFKSLGQYTTRLKSISKKRLSSQLNLATEKEKHHVMEA